MGISSSLDSVTQHIIKNLGSFSLSIYHPQCQLHPQAGSPVSMRRLSAVGKAIISSRGLLGEEESLAPYDPLKTVRNLFFSEHTLCTLPGMHPGPNTE